MKKLYFMAVAAIAALSSCTSDNDLEMNKNTGKEALTFTATMEDSEATRATYDNTNQCAAWEVGDKISINGVSYSSQTAGTTTTFKATTTGQEASGPTFSAYFACEYDGETATLPSSITETWKEGQFNMPMYATSTTTDLAFKNLCGVLKITVSQSQMAKVKSITVSSANCATSGAFTVNEDAAVLTKASTVANTVTVTYSEAVTVAEAGTVFYVAVPAQTYRNLQIAVSDGTHTKGMCTKYGVDVVIGRNKIYPITFTQNAAYAKGIGYVRYVQLWDGGPKFAEINLGASSPEEYGYQYAWGETETKENYTWSTYKWCNGTENTLTKYCTHSSYGTVDNKKELDLEDDAAYVNWGSEWRMPTDLEMRGLKNSCTLEWTTMNGTKGCKATGANGNSIFLPAAGLYSNSSPAQSGGGSGFYWSSSQAWNYEFSIHLNVEGMSRTTRPRYFGLSVRPILK